MDDFLAFGLSFLFNIGIAFLIVRGIYAPTKRDKNYVLTFLTFNTLAFLIAGLLNEIDLSVGFGLGLFAIFSILRFRTDPLPVREMAYLFVMLALPVINAVLLQEEIYDSLIVANLAVAAVLLLAEKGWGLRNVSQKTLTYEHIEWVKPEHYPALLADLRARTGLDIIHCEIGKIDFLHDVAEIKITYNEPQNDVVVVVRSGEPTTDYSALFATSGPRKTGSDSHLRQPLESH